MTVKEIIFFFTDTIFRKKPDEYKNPVVRWAARQYKLLFYTVQGLSQHGTMVQSAAMTFYTLISIVPIVALVFAVVKGFGLLDGLVENLYGIFPQMPEVVDYVVEFAQKTLARTQSGWVAAISLVTLFWSVIRVFGSVEDAFNNIWEVKSTRSIARKYTDYIAVVIIAPLLWIVASSAGTYVNEIFGIDVLVGWVQVASKAFSLVITWLMFTFIYVLLPNTKVRFGSALISAIIAGTIFLLFQWGYVFLQKWMTSYNAIYGSFAALPLFLIWMQTSWQILLLGGELSFAFQNIQRFDEERESLLASYDCRRKLMVAVMVIVGKAFRDGRGAVPVVEIRERLALPTRILSNILFTLVSAGMLNEIHREDSEYDVSYAPARDISTLRLYDVLEAVDNKGFGRDNIELKGDDLDKSSAVVERLKDVTRSSSENILLLELMNDDK
ncbi:MAG: YihY/virulence factor BrkB family protein [Rikenellaceae bacterium]|nr:YihY/virulence factor BrkB family protein [Rikenellaceae bacterium]